MIVSSLSSNETTILLAKASKLVQEPFMGNQAERVFLFLGTDDFWHDYNEMIKVGINFVRKPKAQDYGTMAYLRFIQ